MGKISCAVSASLYYEYSVLFKRTRKLAERLRLELRSLLSQADGLAIHSNTIMGPFQYKLFIHIKMRFLKVPYALSTVYYVLYPPGCGNVGKSAF